MKSDGRSRRALQGQRRVGEALVALIVESGRMPDVSTVARRAGVGRRSLFRYFDGVQALEVETARAMRGMFTELVPLPVPRGSFDERLTALVRHRAALYERITPVRRFLDAARARGNAQLATIIDEGRAALRSSLRSMLAPELRARPALLRAAEVVTSWEAWCALREGLACSVATSRREVTRLLRALFASPKRARSPRARPAAAPGRSRR